MQCAVYCNTRIDGGGEKSAAWIAGKLGCPVYSLTTNEWKEKEPPLKQVWYMNDFSQKLNDPDKKDDFKRIVEGGEKIYIACNFVNGNVHKTDWLAKKTKKVFFLNHDKLNEFQDKCLPEWKGVEKVALPPPVEISQYLDIERPIDRQVVVGRHSRMSLKYPEDPGYIYRELLKRDNTMRFAFQIPHRKITNEFKDDPRFRLQAWNEQSVHDFLASIDIYASIISPKVRDQGPRTLIEAMASGLPCVVENRDGMKERMIHGETGFLVGSQDEAIARILELYRNKDMRVQMGENARNRAKSFDPNNWIKKMGE